MGGNVEVKAFPCSEALLRRRETPLARDRLGTYLAASGEDQVQALRLHTWNTAVSDAFYGPLQGIKFALRNAMHAMHTHSRQRVMLFT